MNTKLNSVNTLSEFQQIKESLYCEMNQASKLGDWSRLKELVEEFRAIEKVMEEELRRRGWEKL